MKKIILTTAMLTLSLFAQSGEEIYNNMCLSCHIKTKPFGIDKSKLKAPPIFGVVKHVKAAHPDKASFVEFVADYIKQPSKEKALCLPQRIDKFGLMPPIGAGMSKEDRVKVASWIYDNINPPKRGQGRGMGHGMGRGNGQGMGMGAGRW